jgi:hypothetical protein
MDAHSALLMPQGTHRPIEEAAMIPTYTPIRPLIRCVFAAAALVATLACGAFVDGLARGYMSEAQQVAITPLVASGGPTR